MPKPLKAIPGEEEYLGQLPNEQYQYDAAVPTTTNTEQPYHEIPTIEEFDPHASMAAFLPKEFGKQEIERNVSAQFDRTSRPLPESLQRKPKSAPISDDDDDEDDDDDDDDSDYEEEFPVSNELVVSDHQKPISTISLDPSGTRIVTGSHDYTLKFYDFPSMSLDHLHSFKTIEPSESHHIHTAAFSQLDSGQHILVVPAAPQAKILSRDGDTVAEFAKGDMYLRDMHHTKGHVSEMTSGAWSPVDKNVVVTAGTDSTLRIWDINNRRAHRDLMVHKSRTGKGGRSRMCCVAWTGGDAGKSMIASVALDGALVVYPGEGPFTRPAMEVRDAHERESWTGGITFSGDGRLLATKGGDETIKLWDTRKMKTPVTTRNAFPTGVHPESTLVFSPNSSNILTGDSAGNLHILSPATLKTEHLIPITPNSPLISLIWHPKLSQILTGSSSGQMHILFSPRISSRGANIVVARAPRKKHIDDDAAFTTDLTAISSESVILPNAILGKPKNQAGSLTKKSDPRRPNIPRVTPWGKSQPDQEHVKKNISLSSMRDEDPREALLKYAEAAEKDPVFTGVWKKNQPTTIYAEVEEDEEEKEMGSDRKRIRR
ncbi:hypothetical protein RUND412_010828 [Rhizina undulata]